MKKLLSAFEAGQYLGVGRSTFLKLAKEKQLTSLRIGKKRVFWDVSDLDTFICLFNYCVDTCKHIL